MVEPSYTPFTNFNFEVTLTLPKDTAGTLGLPDQLCKGQFSECDGHRQSIAFRSSLR